METSHKLKGIIVPIITPWNNGKFDKSSFARVGDYILEGGADGLFVLGYTGEFHKITFEDKRAIIETAVRSFGGFGNKLLIGVTGNTLEETCTLAKYVDEIGGIKKVDAVVIAPTYQPYHEAVGYINPLEYIARFIQETDSPNRLGLPILPIVLYVNLLLGNLLDVNTSRNPKIIGVKDSSGDMEYFSKWIKLQSLNFSVFQGNEALIRQTLAEYPDLDGCVPGTANVKPKFFVNLLKDKDPHSFKILDDILEQYKKAGDAVKVIKQIALSEGLITSAESINYI